jgi:hypothetical protein
MVDVKGYLLTLCDEKIRQLVVKQMAVETTDDAMKIGTEIQRVRRCVEWLNDSDSVKAA